MHLYRPGGGLRGNADGPHIHLLNYMNAVRRQKPAEERNAMLLTLANTYGLLGTFYDWYSAPVLPEGKLFVRPEAVISKRSRKLQELDEADGFDLLERHLRHEFADPSFRLDPDKVANPSELRFFTKRSRLPGRPDPAGYEPYLFPRPWDELKEGYKALIVLDPFSSTRCSVIYRREPGDRWLYELSDLPLRTFETLSDKRDALLYLNEKLTGVSPYVVLNDNGEAERSWRVTSLAQAMHLMLYLDLTGGADVRRCKLSDCGNYFLVDKGSRRKYCPGGRCGSRATTRRSRGQEP